MFRLVTFTVQPCKLDCMQFFFLTFMAFCCMSSTCYHNCTLRPKQICNSTYTSNPCPGMLAETSVHFKLLCRFVSRISNDQGMLRIVSITARFQTTSLKLPSVTFASLPNTLGVSFVCKYMPYRVPQSKGYRENIPSNQPTVIASPCMVCTYVCKYTQNCLPTGIQISPARCACCDPA